MLKRLWKRGEIAPEEQFLLLSTVLSFLVLDFYVKTSIRFSLRDERLFEITEVEITRVNSTSAAHIAPTFIILSINFERKGSKILAFWTLYVSQRKWNSGVDV